MPTATPIPSAEVVFALIVIVLASLAITVEFKGTPTAVTVSPILIVYQFRRE